MSRTVELHLGINGTFCARRWEAPGNWMSLTHELGFTCHEFSTDVLDPFFSGDHEFQLAQARQAREAADRLGVRISALHTGLASRRFHGLSHSDPIARQRMIEWACACMDIATALGAGSLGGRWDTIPVEVIEQGERSYDEAIRRLHEALRDLAQVARDKGLEALYQEQSCVPAEPPWTIKQAEELLIEVNRGARGCPVYLAIDVGRMAGRQYGLSGRELDYCEWLKALAPFAQVIHLQQTTPDAVLHWPFTAPRNERGHIRIEPLIEAVAHGHAHFEESWVSEVLQPVARCALVVHVIPPATQTERALLDDLKATADYLKQHLPDGKLTLTV